MTTSTMRMRRAPAPFAEGAIRIAYHSQLARTEDELGLEKRAMDMKSFKHHGTDLNNRKQHSEQMEVSTIAHFWPESTTGRRTVRTTARWSEF